jgi:anti-sigma regulatory factor (Ser/Thr protein kinase)
MKTLAVRFEIESDPRELAEVQPRLVGLFQEGGLGTVRSAEFATAVIEALNNCIEHAYELRPGQPIWIQIDFLADRIRVQLRDRGKAMPPPPRPGEATLPENMFADSGRGWFIIQAYCDSVEHDLDAHGNLLTLERRLA